MGGSFRKGPARTAWTATICRIIAFLIKFGDFGLWGPGTTQVWKVKEMFHISLRVQVHNKHTLAQNLYHNYYYPNPKYLLIGYMDPLGLFRGDLLRVRGHR